MVISGTYRDRSQQNEYRIITSWDEQDGDERASDGEGTGSLAGGYLLTSPGQPDLGNAGVRLNVSLRPSRAKPCRISA